MANDTQFVTEDVGLAAYLAYAGYEIVRVQTSNYSFKIIFTAPSLDLADDVQAYEDGTAAVFAKEFSRATAFMFSLKSWARANSGEWKVSKQFHFEERANNAN